MKRRDFFRSSTLATISTALVDPWQLRTESLLQKTGRAKNIIFLVSDGMSTGTLNMADLLRQRKEGRSSHWLGLYRDNRVHRALMDTASASSLVTDSAAASSAWGGGVRVPNGSLNVGANGETYEPILQTFKKAGKAVGCVTTVPITHATPAGFCVASKSRGSMAAIAEQYLELRFDVMMGGGSEQFSAEGRADKKDVFAQFDTQGYQVARNRDAMLQFRAGKPALGVFHSDGLPYALDRAQSPDLQKTIPTLAEMTRTAIELMRGNPKGFVLQVEGGKVDWAAHANDLAALLYDQLAFDDAVGEAIQFAEQDQETLIVVTTDHGNANPGLLSGSAASRQFDSLHTVKHTNEWVLKGISKETTAGQLIERLEAAQGIVLKADEANRLLAQFTSLDETGIYNPNKLPYRQLAGLQTAHTSVGWAGMDHTADFVELAILGPGVSTPGNFTRDSMSMPALVKNTDLHTLMLQATGVNKGR
ncbi:alkaline phosphatase [Spirosoma lacussanchae]|uniref:alkaline phosphatase n=1 Tax=Spirosoma lacussanchae TaxID=1884249 RepID=UPI001108B830|nr:alkaline phosphatase [Spirosoma lacussanchae]